jgi:hypothetical protein
MAIQVHHREQRTRLPNVSQREMFVPLEHPAEHARADVEEMLVEISSQGRKTHTPAVDAPHSADCFVMASRCAPECRLAFPVAVLLRGSFTASSSQRAVSG